MQPSQAKSLFFFQSGLDNELLYELYESDYESTLQAFQIFLDELETNIKDLEHAYQQQNISAFQKIVHRCKPVFSYVGLSELNGIFQRMEDQCNTITDLGQLTPKFSELVPHIRSTSSTIENEKRRLEEYISKN
jgi:HPt (histidine-containing phosphotransfer) domain-containing protein